MSHYCRKMSQNSVHYTHRRLLAHSILILMVCISHVYSQQRLCDGEEMFCTVGLCDVAECDMCHLRIANCKTDNHSEPIPQTIPADTKILTVDYQGPTVGLNSQMFARYLYLSHVTISGSFNNLAMDTFKLQPSIHGLEIHHTLINSIPDRLFYEVSPIQYLSLRRNRLTLVPQNLFYQTRHLVNVDISYNPIDLCKMNSIGEGFRQLTKLGIVSLKGLGKSPIQNCSFHHHFLSPLSHVHTIDLSESLILQGREYLVQALDHTYSLAINNMDGYKLCPANVSKLFQYLPTNLTIIQAKSWKTTQPITDNCMLTSKTFEYLSVRGSKLSTLFFAYGDKIFGDKISPKMLSNLTLHMIDISWCGISSIEDGAFDSYPYLASLSLDGNQLGPRKFQPFSKPRTGQRLYELNLNNMNLFSDDQVQYDLSSTLTTSPQISELLMSGNFMKKIPKFAPSVTNATSANALIPYSITVPNLNENSLADLSKNTTAELCYVMPLLQTFRASNNKISDITGLCMTIEHLYLADNYISENSADNYKVMKEMTEIINMDISRNGILGLPSDLLTNMPRLKKLVLAGNEIASLPKNIFSKNQWLYLLDMSGNELSSVDYSTFKFSDSFGYVYLQSNLIHSIHIEITKRVEFLSNRSLVMFDISGNPLDCTCDTGYLQEWVKNSLVIADVKNLTCGNQNTNRENNLIYNYSYTEIYCKDWLTKGIIAGSALLALLIGVPLGISAYKNSWYIRHINVVVKAIIRSAKRAKVEQQCRYDAYVSYDSQSDSDLSFVQQMLIPQLEQTDSDIRYHNTNEKGECLSLYIHDRDAELGAMKFANICQAIEDSRKIIILLSSSYVANNSCLNEANMLAGYETDGADCYHPNRILILVLEEPDEEIIRPPITGLLTGNVIDVTSSIRRSSRKMERAWGRIRKFIAKPKYIYKKTSRKRKSTRQNTINTGAGRFTYQSISQA